MKAALLAAGLLLPAGAETLTRGPYLIGTSASSATVCWRLGTSRKGDSCFTKEGLALDAPFTYTVPGSTRTYRARSLPSPGRKIRFAAFGDMGQGARVQHRVARILKDWAPEFVLVLGDIVYPKGHDKDYDEKYFKPYANLLPHIAFMPAIGNHDYGFKRRKKAEKRYRKHYARIHRRQKYYSFDSGYAHFVSLDTNLEGFGVRAAESARRGSPQWEWLDRDLARSKARWKIVFLHIPLYASGWHGNNEELISALAPLFRRHGVDIVFQGHNHHYERSRPIDGVVYIVAGSGGGSLYRRRYRNDWSAKFEIAHGFVGTTLDRDVLALEFLDSDGRVRDTHRIEKE